MFPVVPFDYIRAVTRTFLNVKPCTQSFYQLCHSPAWLDVTAWIILSFISTFARALFIPLFSFTFLSGSRRCLYSPSSDKRYNFYIIDSKF